MISCGCVEFAVLRFCKKTIPAIVGVQSQDMTIDRESGVTFYPCHLYP